MLIIECKYRHIFTPTLYEYRLEYFIVYYYETKTNHNYEA